MKIGVFGLPDFLFGKKSLPDDRLAKMKELYRCKKTTMISVEFVPSENLKAVDAIVCLKEKKVDLLILDMETVESRLATETFEDKKALLLRAQSALEAEKALCEAGFSYAETVLLSQDNLITLKPVIFVEKGEADNLPALASRVYKAAGMVSFLTGGPKECRAWELKGGSTALTAAGKVHSDIARGFIVADVLAYDDLIKAGHPQQAKNNGSVRQEGKDYLVQDGDIIEFKFNV